MYKFPTFLKARADYYNFTKKSKLPATVAGKRAFWPALANWIITLSQVIPAGALSVFFYWKLHYLLLATLAREPRLLTIVA